MKVIDQRALKHSPMRMLLYGRAGSYKTRTAGTAAFAGPTLMLTAGGNPISIRDYNPSPTIVQIDELSDFNGIYDYLYTGQKPQGATYALLGSPTEPFRFLIVDGATDIGRKVMNQVMQDDKKGGQPNKKVGDLSKAFEIQHHGQSWRTMNFWASHFFELTDIPINPLHIIMTALEHELVEGDVHSYRPSFFGQLAGDFESYAYIVGRMVAAERLTSVQKTDLGIKKDDIAESVMLLKHTPRWPAKDQYGVLGDYLINPTIPDIVRAIYGGN